jgi:hypothetical protein
MVTTGIGLHDQVKAVVTVQVAEQDGIDVP